MKIIDNARLKVEVKNVYGNELIYPVCDTAKRFSTLTGKKTFSPYTLKLITDLGYSVENVAPSLPSV